jgi:hypothetical protein
MPNVLQQLADVPEWDALSTIPELDGTDLADFYPSAASDAKLATVRLDGSRTLRRAPTSRGMRDLRKIANAIRTIDRLPADGETIHLILGTDFDGWDLVPAILELAGEATIDELNVATLGFNRRNAAELLELMDAGAVGRVTFIVSHFYRTHEGDVVDELFRGLAARGSPHVGALRCHAKVILAELSDGRCIVSESSANLRSCRNIEQSTITQDRSLLEFHRAWMLEAIAA